jgi:HAD superfamily hydrolase (TIGR01509 family)
VRVVEAAVFDCDGLLLDTEDLWLRGEAELFAEHGREYTPEDRERLLGVSVHTLGPTLETLLERPGHGETLVADLLERCWGEVAAGARPQPGAVELVRELTDRRVPVAVASNSPRALVREALETAELDGAFSVVLGADDVGRPKPAPELYLLACERLNSAPARSVALEDSPTGVSAARAAGMYVIGVPSVPDTALDEAHLVAGSLKAPEVRTALAL